MDWKALEDNGDIEKAGHFPYQELQDVVKAGQRDTANHVISKVFDLLLANGWKASEIIEAVTNQASQKFKNDRATLHLESAARELFEVERSEQSNS